MWGGGGGMCIECFLSVMDGIESVTLLFYGSVLGLKSVLLLVCGWPENFSFFNVWVELWFYS